MSDNPTWLECLQHATTYRELQAAFDQMWTAANTTGAQPNMVAMIDEAIHRIEQERSRDQAELAQFNDQYASFKDQNSGVMGWFKRKMPFTSTHSQDVELRESMRDQEAEILADNFVIAFAQMLKETLLPPETARCGRPNQYYRESLAAHDSVAQLSDLGNVVTQMNGEVPKAEQFIAQLRSDIDAFADAKFTDKVDMNLKKTEVGKAQQALSGLSKGVDEKKNLIAAAEERLRKLLEQQLSEQDPSYRSLQQHRGQLEDFLKQCDQLKPLVEARTELLGKLKVKASEVSTLPQKISSLQQKLDQAQSDSQVAESAWRQAEADAQPFHQRYEAARQAAEQARLRVEATQPLVQAYLSEQGLDLSAAVEQVDCSPVCAEYESLKAAAAVGQSQLQQALTLYNSAKGPVQQRQAECEKLANSCRDLQQELNKLQQEMVTQQSQLAALCDQYQLNKHVFQSSATEWQSARAALNWNPQLSTAHLLPAELFADLFGPSLVNSIGTSATRSSSTAYTSPASRIHENRGTTLATSVLKVVEDALAVFVKEFQNKHSSSKAIHQQLTQDRLHALQQSSRMVFSGDLANKLFPGK